jgi:hypothetical protein
MDTALHADLRGARGPGLVRAVADLLQGQGVRVRIGAPLRERAEPAAGVADVREVDVPGDHVGDIVAADLTAERVSDAGQRLEVRAIGGEEGDRLVVGQGGRVPLRLPERARDVARSRHGWWGD